MNYWIKSIKKIEKSNLSMYSFFIFYPKSSKIIFVHPPRGEGNSGKHTPLFEIAIITPLCSKTTLCKLEKSDFPFSI